MDNRAIINNREQEKHNARSRAKALDIALNKLQLIKALANSCVDPTVFRDAVINIVDSK